MIVRIIKMEIKKWQYLYIHLKIILYNSYKLKKNIKNEKLIQKKINIIMK